MTSEQTMLTRFARAAMIALGLAAAGCASEPALTPPQGLASPYDTVTGEVLWAVAPFRNESGTTLLDADDISDKVVAAAAQVRGVRALPLNRTLHAMRALNMTGIGSPADAKRLAQEMGVDGLILGSITAYDPYDPPKLGLALALYARPGSMNRRGERPLDPRTLSSQPTDYNPFPRSTYTDAPTSAVSEFLDGKNHQVQMDLRHYAAGRHEPDSAMGWKRYLASMDLFSEFAAWHAVGRLLDREWLRLARVTPDEGGG